MRIRVAGSIESMSNSDFFAKVIFFQGCDHIPKCIGCHNEHTWSFDMGKEVCSIDIISDIINIKYIKGIVISGGEPFAQPLGVKELAECAKKHGLIVWAYTGYSYDYVLEKYPDILPAIDVLVDGKFDKSLISNGIRYRGSSNQRIIDVKRSLSVGDIVLRGDLYE